MTRNLALLTLLCMAETFVGCGEATPPEVTPTPTTIDLPASISFPEGIAYDEVGGALYTGSALDGALIRIDPATGAIVEVAAAGTLVSGDDIPFPTVLGMEIDNQRRLWIAGGRTGKAWVVSAADGAVLREVTVPSVGTSLLNDVALVAASAYFTDTFVPTLWRLPVQDDGTIGEIEPWLDLTGTPIPYGEGAGLNGIVATPNGQNLLVVHMGQGLLFAIDVATKEIRQIDTGGEDLTGADGLVLDGNTLYVIRQTAVEIATLELDEAMTSATVVSRFTDPTLAWPATASKVGDELIVVNTQFNTREDSSTVLPFTLLRLPVSLLAGAGEEEGED